MSTSPSLPIPTAKASYRLAFGLATPATAPQLPNVQALNQSLSQGSLTGPETDSFQRQTGIQTMVPASANPYGLPANTAFQLSMTPSQAGVPVNLSEPRASGITSPQTLSPTSSLPSATPASPVTPWQPPQILDNPALQTTSDVPANSQTSGPLRPELNQNQPTAAETNQTEATKSDASKPADTEEGTVPKKPAAQTPVKPLDPETEEDISQTKEQASALIDKALRKNPELASDIANTLEHVDSREDIKALYDDPESPLNGIKYKLYDHRPVSLLRRPVRVIGRVTNMFVPQDIRPDFKNFINWITTKPSGYNEAKNARDYFSSRTEAKKDETTSSSSSKKSSVESTDDVEADKPSSSSSDNAVEKTSTTSTTKTETSNKPSATSSEESTEKKSTETTSETSNKPSNTSTDTKPEKTSDDTNDGGEKKNIISKATGGLQKAWKDSQL